MNAKLLLASFFWLAKPRKHANAEHCLASSPFVPYHKIKKIERIRLQYEVCILNRDVYNNRLNLSQRFVTVHATRYARSRMNRANYASQVKRMLGRRLRRGGRL